MYIAVPISQGQNLPPFLKNINSMGKRSICNNTFGTDYDSKYWLVLDPAGILVVTFLYFLITSTVVVVYKDIVMLDNSNITLVIIFYVLYIPTVVLMVVSHVRCWWTNPGAVVSDAEIVPMN